MLQDDENRTLVLLSPRRATTRPAWTSVRLNPPAGRAQLNSECVGLKVRRKNAKAERVEAKAHSENEAPEGANRATERVNRTTEHANKLTERVNRLAKRL